MFLHSTIAPLGPKLGQLEAAIADGTAPMRSRIAVAMTRSPNTSPQLPKLWLLVRLPRDGQACADSREAHPSFTHVHPEPRLPAGSNPEPGELPAGNRPRERACPDTSPPLVPWPRPGPLNLRTP